MVPHLCAQTHRLDFSPLGFYAKKLPVKVFFWREIQIHKKEMELFLPLPVIEWKNFFNKRFLIRSNDFKIDFRNRKWNYLNRKWNYFSPFQSSDQKTSLTEASSFGPSIPKMVFRNRKRNCLNRKWNYFSPFQSSDLKTYLTKVSPFGPMFPKWLSETGNGII